MAGGKGRLELDELAAHVVVERLPTRRRGPIRIRRPDPADNLRAPALQGSLPPRPGETVGLCEETPSAHRKAFAACCCQDFGDVTMTRHHRSRKPTCAASQCHDAPDVVAGGGPLVRVSRRQPQARDAHCGSAGLSGRWVVNGSLATSGPDRPRQRSLRARICAPKRRTDPEADAANGPSAIKA